MWVFLNNTSLSIVAHRYKTQMLLVRARRQGDIEAVFHEAKVRHTPNHDYPYRAALHRTIVAAKLAELVGSIDYENFKGSVSDIDRHEAYFEVWRVMREYQQNGKDRTRQ